MEQLLFAARGTGVSKDVEEELTSLRARLDAEGPMTPRDYERFLEERGLLSVEAKHRLDDLRHFRETRRLRRPDKWPVGT